MLNAERIFIMATVIENKKNGKTVSFKFRAYLGRNEIGKQVNKYTTWFAPDGLTPAKALKAAEKAATSELRLLLYDKSCFEE